MHTNCLEDRGFGETVGCDDLSFMSRGETEGTITFRADGTFEENTRVTGSVQLTFPKACDARFEDCDNTRSPGLESTVRDTGSACVHTLDATADAKTFGMWQRDGDSLQLRLTDVTLEEGAPSFLSMAAGSTLDATVVVPYCVRGDELSILSEPAPNLRSFRVGMRQP